MQASAPVRYSHSSTKVRNFGLLWIGFLLVFVVVGLLSPEKKYVWLSCLVIMTVCVLYAIRTTAKDAHCGSCAAQLFEIIEAAKAIRTRVNFCPNCGVKIRIDDTNLPNAGSPDASAE